MPDLINGLFESFGAFFIFLSIRRVWADKQVHGVSVLHSAFFLMWGFWNIFYYSHLSQWFSLTGGLAIALSNTVWFALLVYYSKYPGEKS